MDSVSACTCPLPAMDALHAAGSVPRRRCLQALSAVWFPQTSCWRRHRLWQTGSLGALAELMKPARAERGNAASAADCLNAQDAPPPATIVFAARAVCRLARLPRCSRQCKQWTACRCSRGCSRSDDYFCPALALKIKERAWKRLLRSVRLRLAIASWCMRWCSSTACSTGLQHRYPPTMLSDGRRFGDSALVISL